MVLGLAVLGSLSVRERTFWRSLTPWFLEGDAAAPCAFSIPESLTGLRGPDALHVQRIRLAVLLATRHHTFFRESHGSSSCCDAAQYLLLQARIERRCHVHLLAAPAGRIQSM